MAVPKSISEEEYTPYDYQTSPLFRVFIARIIQCESLLGRINRINRGNILSENEVMEVLRLKIKTIDTEDIKRYRQYEADASKKDNYGQHTPESIKSKEEATLLANDMFKEVKKEFDLDQEISKILNPITEEKKKVIRNIFETI